jgi:hypothetical protein
MPDETTIEDLRAELERQREEQEARHQALLDHLARDGRPMTQADASRTMRDGYAAEAERRVREAAEGEGDES